MGWSAGDVPHQLVGRCADDPGATGRKQLATGAAASLRSFRKRKRGAIPLRAHTGRSRGAVLRLADRSAGRIFALSAAGRDAAKARKARLSCAPRDSEKKVGLHRYFSNPGKVRKTLISRVINGSKSRRIRSSIYPAADSRDPMREKSSQSQTRLSSSNHKELLAGYAEGVPVRDLAERFNIHRSTVRDNARRAGLPGRSPEHPKHLRAKAARLYREGLTLSQVADHLGIGDEAVRSAVVAPGGTIRPKGRRRILI